jgi:hypothetical protein
MSEEGSATVKLRRKNRWPSGDEDRIRIGAAKKSRGSPAVANELRSRHKKV